MQTVVDRQLERVAVDDDVPRIFVREVRGRHGGLDDPRPGLDEMARVRVADRAVDSALQVSRLQRDARPRGNACEAGRRWRDARTLRRPVDSTLDTCDELYDGVVHGKPMLHDGRWGMATIEVAEALLQSGAERREIMLAHQVPAND